jgi:hypothetical protein
MNNAEYEILLKTAEAMAEIEKSRNDMIIGISAAILDLHRLLIQAGHQTKQDAISRLTVQRDDIASKLPDGLGTAYLGALIASLTDDKLDAAGWLRQPTSGSA